MEAQGVKRKIFYFVGTVAELRKLLKNKKFVNQAVS
jgi:hypothetical protein